VRTEPLTPLSPLPRCRDRSHVHESSREPPRSPQTDSRERACPDCNPGCLPSDENLCPATSFRTPGSGLSRLRGLATAVPVVDAVDPPACPLRSSPRAWSPSTRPFAIGIVFLWTLASFADFCNRCRRAGTPCRAVVPRTRVRLSPRYSLAPTDASCVGPFTRCRVGSRRAAHCTPRLSHGAFHLRGRGSCTGRSDREKVKRAFLTMPRVPSS